MQVPGPPAFLFHLDEAFHLDDLVVRGSAEDLEVAGHKLVFRPALHLEGVLAWWKLEDDDAVEGKMVLPKRQLWRLHWLAAAIFQMHPRREWFARCLVNRSDLELTVLVCGNNIRGNAQE